MRIISGKYRGKIIRAPKNLPIRPTTDMARESLFNIIGNHFYWDDMKALDLFSGMGGVSLELASRSCTDITAVDEHPACVSFLKKTTEELKFEGVQVIRADAIRFLSSNHQQYDFIFADPPYDYAHYEEIIELVFGRKLLAENALLVLEHYPQRKFDDHPFFFEMRKYGGVCFSFFKERTT